MVNARGNSDDRKNPSPPPTSFAEDSVPRSAPQPVAGIPEAATVGPSVAELSLMFMRFCPANQPLQMLGGASNSTGRAPTAAFNITPKLSAHAIQKNEGSGRQKSTVAVVNEEEGAVGGDEQTKDDVLTEKFFNQLTVKFEEKERNSIGGVPNKPTNKDKMQKRVRGGVFSSDFCPMPSPPVPTVAAVQPKAKPSVPELSVLQGSSGTNKKNGSMKKPNYSQFIEKQQRYQLEQKKQQHEQEQQEEQRKRLELQREQQELLQQHKQLQKHEQLQCLKQQQQLELQRQHSMLRPRPKKFLESERAIMMYQLQSAQRQIDELQAELKALKNIRKDCTSGRGVQSPDIQAPPPDRLDKSTQVRLDYLDPLKKSKKSKKHANRHDSSENLRVIIPTPIPKEPVVVDPIEDHAVRTHDNLVTTLAQIHCISSASRKDVPISAPLVNSPASTSSWLSIGEESDVEDDDGVAGASTGRRSKAMVAQIVRGAFLDAATGVPSTDRNLVMQQLAAKYLPEWQQNLISRAANEVVRQRSMLNEDKVESDGAGAAGSSTAGDDMDDILIAQSTEEKEILLAFRQQKMMTKLGQGGVAPK